MKLTLPGGKEVEISHVSEMKSWIWNQLSSYQILECSGCKELWLDESRSCYCEFCERCDVCYEWRVRSPCDGCGRS